MFPSLILEIFFILFIYLFIFNKHNFHLHFIFAPYWRSNAVNFPNVGLLRCSILFYSFQFYCINTSTSNQNLCLVLFLSFSYSLSSLPVFTPKPGFFFSHFPFRCGGDRRLRQPTTNKLKDEMKDKKKGGSSNSIPSKNIPTDEGGNNIRMSDPLKPHC